MKGIIFDIQQYAIYDGPGIRTLVFFKGCPLKCFWCQNPESQNPKPQISYFREKCTLCGICVDNCPNEALILSDNGIIRDDNLCNTCGSCVEACPDNVMELIGEEKSVKEISSIVLRDKPFYNNSGGGVTVSGGEPTYQKKFLIEMLTNLKNNGIHTAIETCGYFNPKLIDDLIPVVDLFLFDIKHIDPDLHKKYTGVSNEKILENFKTLYKKVGSKGIICRIPLIPKININHQTIQGIINFLQDIGYNGPIHLMPYNKLAKTKYEKIGRGGEYRDMGELHEEDIEEIIKIIEKDSFEAVINE